MNNFDNYNPYKEEDDGITDIVINNIDDMITCYIFDDELLNEPFSIIINKNCVLQDLLYKISYKIGITIQALRFEVNNKQIMNIARFNDPISLYLYRTNIMIVKYIVCNIRIEFNLTYKFTIELLYKSEDDNYIVHGQYILYRSIVNESDIIEFVYNIIINNIMYLFYPQLQKISKIINCEIIELIDTFLKYIKYDMVRIHDIYSNYNGMVSIKPVPKCYSNTNNEKISPKLLHHSINDSKKIFNNISLDFKLRFNSKRSLKKFIYFTKDWIKTYIITEI